MLDSILLKTGVFRITESKESELHRLCAVFRITESNKTHVLESVVSIKTLLSVMRLQFSYNRVT